jgi:hypothetical protein
VRNGRFSVFAIISLAAACSSYPSVERKRELVNVPDAGSPAASGGTSGGVIDTDGSLDSGENQDGSCGASAWTATVRPVQVLLVLDSSKSMNQTPAGFSGSKWVAMRTALADVLDQTKDSLSYGLELFPQGASDTDFCRMPAAIGVPVAPGTQSAAQILGVFDQTVPAGGTPTAAALVGALEYFTNGGGKDLGGDKVVLLATDGGPNCNSTLTCGIDRCTTNLDGTTCVGAPGGNCCVGGLSCLDDAAAVSAAAALLQNGIKTLVVGIPGSDVYSTTLDQLAAAGRATDGGASTDAGAPGYFRVDASGGTSGLTSVLLGITKKLINTCRLELAQKPPNPDLLNVEIDGTRIPQQGPDGWELDQNSSPWAVVLKGTTCAKIETEGAQKVNIVYGCPTVQ